VGDSGYDENHYGRKPYHSSVLDWARAFGSVGWIMPPRERRPVAVDWDETVEKVNGREVHAWAAMDVDTGGAPRDQGDMVQELHGRALLFLSRVLKAFAPKVWGEVGLMERRRTPAALMRTRGSHRLVMSGAAGPECLNGISQ